MAIGRKISDPQEFVNEFIEKIGKVPVKDVADPIFLSNDDSGAFEKETYDVLIICALPNEKDRVFDAFAVPEVDRRRIIQSFRADYNFVYQKFTYAKFNIAIATQNAMGMAAAASLVTRAILAMKPKLVAMTGICAGRKTKVDLGDIIVADQVFDYTAGKKNVDRFSPRPLSFSAEDTIRNCISAKILNNDKISDSILQAWKGSRIHHRISIHMKSIASGTSVIDDKQTMDAAAAVNDNLYGIDMESYGVALAAVALRTPWLVAKAVQDFADGDKAQDEKEIRDFSAFASAMLLKEILHDIVD